MRTLKLLSLSFVLLRATNPGDATVSRQNFIGGNSDILLRHLISCAFLIKIATYVANLQRTVISMETSTMCVMVANIFVIQYVRPIHLLSFGPL